MPGILKILQAIPSRTENVGQEGFSMHVCVQMQYLSHLWSNIWQELLQDDKALLHVIPSYTQLCRCNILHALFSACHCAMISATDHSGCAEGSCSDSLQRLCLACFRTGQ